MPPKKWFGSGRRVERRNHSYAETFNILAKMMLREPTKSPLKLLLGDEFKGTFEEAKTPILIQRMGHAVLVVRELQLIWINYEIRQLPFQISDLQKKLGVESRVVNENIVSFDRAVAIYEKAEKEKTKTNSQIHPWFADPNKGSATSKKQEGCLGDAKDNS